MGISFIHTEDFLLSIKSNLRYFISYGTKVEEV